MAPFFFSTTIEGNQLFDANIPLPKEFGVTQNHSNILAAVTEIDGNGHPFQGVATIQACGIAPSDDSVTVRLLIQWDNPLRVRIALVIWP